MTDQASHMRHNEQAVDSTHHAHHIVPPRVYIIVILILLVLTIATVLVAYVNLGGLWNLVLALGLATIKATIVALWFMHVRYSGRLVQLTIVASLMFLGLMIFGTLMDVYTRNSPIGKGFYEINKAPYTTETDYHKMQGVKLPHGDDSIKN